MPSHLAHGRPDHSPVLLDIPQWTYDYRVRELSRANARLEEENERLRASCASLTDSANVWIRLYEAALARAAAAEARPPARMTR